MNRRAYRSSTRLVFECPGCGSLHAPNVEPEGNVGPWSWNGSTDRPTLSPSVLIRWTRRPENAAPVDEVCHSFVRDGRIEFLSDCTHGLAGSTVDLPEIEVPAAEEGGGGE